MGLMHLSFTIHPRIIAVGLTSTLRRGSQLIFRLLGKHQKEVPVSSPAVHIPLVLGHMPFELRFVPSGAREDWGGDFSGEVSELWEWAPMRTCRDDWDVPYRLLVWQVP